MTTRRSRTHQMHPERTIACSASTPARGDQRAPALRTIRDGRPRRRSDRPRRRSGRAIGTSIVRFGARLAA